MGYRGQRAGSSVWSVDGSMGAYAGYPQTAAAWLSLSFCEDTDTLEKGFIGRMEAVVVREKAGVEF